MTGIPPKTRHGIFLGIDLGRARMGLAISDASTRMALAHSVVPRRGTRLDIAGLLPLLHKAQVVGIVVGLPPGDDQGPGSARLCRQFAQALAAAQPLPVWLVDEADTTVEAHAELRLQGMRAAKRRAQVDMHAAAVILGRFLGGAAAEPLAQS